MSVQSLFSDFRFSGKMLSNPAEHARNRFFRCDVGIAVELLSEGKKLKRPAILYYVFCGKDATVPK
jgi:hypothetical protein